MNLQQCYKLLKIPESANDASVTAAYRRMARSLHPDKNRDRIEWATSAMSRLNQAYDIILSYRFKTGKPEEEAPPGPSAEEKPPKKKRKPREDIIHPEEEVYKENLIRSFIQWREHAKDALYRFFQYNLDNLARREKASNQSIYNRMVYDLRRSYHGIKKLSEQTSDKELQEHFSVFMDMIFNFYRSSECLNVIDSYKSQYEVEAYRSYHNGDRALHRAEKELFYDRHNRGFFKRDIVVSSLVEANQYLQGTIKYFPQSSWRIEAEIKYTFTRALIEYVSLFFSEE